jgi:hypothetical protein
VMAGGTRGASVRTATSWPVTASFGERTGTPSYASAASAGVPQPASVAVARSAAAARRVAVARRRDVVEREGRLAWVGWGERLPCDPHIQMRNSHSPASRSVVRLPELPVRHSRTRPCGIVPPG